MNKRSLLVTLVLVVAQALAGAAQAEPDLVVERVSFVPEAPKPLELTEVHATVRNRGDGAAEAFRVALRVDGRIAGTQRVGGLEPGETADVVFNWFGLEGVRVLRVEVNPYRDVAETDRNNNALEATVQVLADPLPDLTIEALTFEPPHPQPGEPATLRVTLRNAGRIAPSGRAVFVIKDGARTVRTLFVEPLGPGEAATYDVPWMPLQGERRLSFEIDAQERIEELDEANNYLVQIVNVSTRPANGAELAVRDLDVVPGAGGLALGGTIEATVVNVGTGAAADFAVRFEADGAALASVQVDLLQPGASVRVSAPWQPSQAGERLVRVLVDEGAVIVEDDESDNALAAFVEAGEGLNRCGQLVYLSLDAPALQALSRLLSLTEEEVRHVFMAKVKSVIEVDYEGLNIRFALEEPGLVHSTARFIGESRRDRLGEAPVDTGNVIKSDVATIFIGSFDSLLAQNVSRSLDALALLIANTASHEVGHFLGLRHDDPTTTREYGGRNMMADGNDAPGSSIFLDAFFTDENLDYLRRILPLACVR